MDLHMVVYFLNDSAMAAVSGIRTCVALMAVAVCCIPASAGSLPVVFDSVSHDFGTIMEKDGPVSHTFTFTNVSETPFVIEDVLSSCGCIVSACSMEPVSPGARGSVKVVFDPSGRTDRFHKSVRVVADGGRTVISLSLKGKVILDEPLEERMQELLPGVYAGTTAVSLGNVQHGVFFPGREVEVYNARNHPVRLGYVCNDQSGCIRIDMPDVLAPRTMSTILVSVSDDPEWFGSLRSDIYLSADGVRAGRPVGIYGYLVDDMRGVAASAAPVCILRDAYFNFREAMTGSVLRHAVVLINGGKSPLYLRKIESSSPLVRIDYVPDSVLLPGESEQILVSVDSSAPAAVDASISVISNDPVSPVKKFRVEGQIL